MQILQNFSSSRAIKRSKSHVLHFDKYDLIKYGYPVDFENCQNHRKANLINKSIHENIQERIICECCGRTVGKQPQALFCYDNKIFAKYGPGIPLYFKFFQYVIVILVIYFAIYGIFGTISNFMSNDCQKFKHCWNEGLGMQLSFLNSYENTQVTFTQLSLILLLIVLKIFIFLFIRYKLKAKKQQFDDLLNSPSDYSIILRQLPKQTTQEDILEMIEYFRFYLPDDQKVLTNNLKVHKIMFAYDLSDYLEVQKSNMDNFKDSCKENSDFYKIPPPKIDKKLSTAIVIFQKESSKMLFTGYLSCIEQLKRSHWLGHQPLSSMVKVKGKHVNVERAPQPDDIFWVNEGLSTNQLLLRRFLVLSFSVGLLAISAILQYFLATWRRGFSQQDEMIQKLFSIGLACLITIINYLITTLLVFSTRFQRPRTYTLQKISLIFKLVLMQFINSGIISIVVTAAIYLPNFRFYKTVICNDMLYIMILNVIVNNAMNFIMVRFQIPSWLDRALLYFKAQLFTQKEANKIFEANEADLQYKYAYVFKTLWLTAFFMPTQPIVVFLSILALLINYWSEKYLFSRFYSIPYMFSGRLSISVLDLLNYTCLWLVSGSFFIHLLRVNFHFRLIPIEYLIFHIIGFILSIFVIYAPLTNISKQIFGDTQTLNEYHRSYEIEQEFFQMTYESKNPAYRKGRKFKRKFDSIAERLAEAFQ